MTRAIHGQSEFYIFSFSIDACSTCMHTCTRTYAPTGSIGYSTKTRDHGYGARCAHTGRLLAHGCNSQGHEVPRTRGCTGWKGMQDIYQKTGWADELQVYHGVDVYTRKARRYTKVDPFSILSPQRTFHPPLHGWCTFSPSHPLAVLFFPFFRWFIRLATHR